MTSGQRPGSCRNITLRHTGHDRAIVTQMDYQLHLRYPKNCIHCRRAEEKAKAGYYKISEDQIRTDQECGPDLKFVIEWNKQEVRPNWKKVAVHNQRVKSYWPQYLK
ncbi:hypothetical protein Trydic_g22826 [Trypoxylus dichotomus]